MPIHPTAIIDPQAEIDSSVEIGPHVIIEGPCRIGARTRILANAVICRWTEIGEDNAIHYGAVIGNEPQHLAYKGEERWTRIGNRNLIRENATIHRAFVEGRATTIGDDCMLMANAHVAHDCHVGSRVVLVNNAMLGGHAEIGDGAFLGGGVGVHQYCRVGRLVMVAGLARVTSDVPPFMMVAGMSKIHSLNVVGLRRAGISPESRKAIKAAYQTLYHRGLPVPRALEAIGGANGLVPEVRELVEFIAASKRGVCAHHGRARTAGAED